MIYRTPKLNKAERRVLHQVENARERLKYRISVPKRWIGILRRNAFARAIRGSNSIEGYHVTAEDAIAAVQGEEPLTAEREAWLAVTGYRNAMTYVLQLAPSFSTPSSQFAIASRLHVTKDVSISRRQLLDVVKPPT